jgi:hypothetical protein
MPLMCTEGGEKEPQVGLMATEDSRPTESDAIILALTPDEALVVDVTKGLDSGAVYRLSSHLWTLLLEPPDRMEEGLWLFPEDSSQFSFGPILCLSSSLFSPSVNRSWESGARVHPL